MERNLTSEDKFYDALVVRALNPDDTFAASEILKRMSPIRKPTMPEVEFEFDKDAKPHIQAAQVMKAAANGDIPPDVASTFINSIASMMKINEITELEERIANLEAVKDEQ